MEGLGDDAGADARKLAAVQLRFAEDVEPKRRPGDDRIPLGLREPRERDAVAGALAICALSAFTSRPCSS
jgi:hypothetical protein